MKKLLSLLLALGMMFVLVGCGTTEETAPEAEETTPEVEEATVLTIITSGDYEPYEFYTADGELTGFDIEVAEAIAVEMGVELNWVDMSFDGIIAALQTGQADLAIAALSPTPERAESIDFTTMYYSKDIDRDWVLTFVEDGIDSIDQLDGLSGLVLQGTVQAEKMTAVADAYGFTFDTRSKMNIVVQELMSGLVDFVVTENATATEYVSNYPELTKMYFDVETDIEDINGNAIGLPQGSELADDLNAAIETLQADGTIDALIEKYLSDVE